MTDPIATNGNGTGTALTVKELLLEVRADLKILVKDYQEHKEGARVAIEQHSERLKGVEERLDEVCVKVEADSKHHITEEAQKSLLRTVFGDNVVPALISLATLGALLVTHFGGI